MVRADNRPLEQRPHVFHAVDVNLASRVFLLRVIDCFVLGIVVCYAPVRFPFVGIDSLNIPGDVLTYEAMQRLPISASDNLKTDVPITLKGTNYYGLVALVASSFALDLAADECLISLHDA